MKKTHLYDEHIRLGGKIVEFTGYALPIQYKGIVAEHNMVREKSGIFDVSHMGEVLIKGDKAFDSVQYLVTNDMTSLEVGSVRYSPMCYNNGTCVDDILVYKIAADEFFLVVNAANKDKDFAWMQANNIYNSQIIDMSDEISQIAIQGPKAQEIASKYFAELPEKYYTFIQLNLEDGTSYTISRTGYTGEDGFEIYTDNNNVAKIFRALLEIGGDDIAPCGLGARDTLRLESAMPLYGHELSDEITPFEAGLARFVKLNKESDFLGKTALIKQKEAKLKRRRCALVLIDKGIARDGAKIFNEGIEVGYVTSGTRSITLKKSIALAMVKRPFNKLGNILEIQVRNKSIKAEVVKVPFK